MVFLQTFDLTINKYQLSNFEKFYSIDQIIVPIFVLPKKMIFYYQEKLILPLSGSLELIV